MKHSLKIHVSKRRLLKWQVKRPWEMDGFCVTCYEEGVNCHITVIEMSTII